MESGFSISRRECGQSKEAGGSLPALEHGNGPLIPARTFWSPPSWTGHFMCPQLFSLPDCSGSRPFSIFSAGFLLQALITRHGWPPLPADSLAVQLLSPPLLCREVFLQDCILHPAGTFSGFPPTSRCATNSFPRLSDHSPLQ